MAKELYLTIWQDLKEWYGLSNWLFAIEPMYPKTPMWQLDWLYNEIVENGEDNAMGEEMTEAGPINMLSIGMRLRDWKAVGVFFDEMAAARYPPPNYDWLKSEIEDGEDNAMEYEE